MNNVHFEEVEPINPVITSKDEIMQICRRIASEEGLKSLGMRKVAKECGIAIGTLYNYFSNKEELLIATITSIWLDIFSLPEQGESSPPLLFSAMSAACRSSTTAMIPVNAVTTTDP